MYAHGSSLSLRRGNPPRFAHPPLRAFRRMGSDNADFAAPVSACLLANGLSQKPASVRDWTPFGHNPSASSAPLAMGTSCVCESSCRTFSSVPDPKRCPTRTQRFPRELPDFRSEWRSTGAETQFSSTPVHTARPSMPSEFLSALCVKQLKEFSQSSHSSYNPSERK